MKVIKFGEFIKENIYDTSEGYIKAALTKIKEKIESYFEYEEKDEEDEGLITMSDALKKGKDDEKNNNNLLIVEDLSLVNKILMKSLAFRL